MAGTLVLLGLIWLVVWGVRLAKRPKRTPPPTPTATNFRRASRHGAGRTDPPWSPYLQPGAPVPPLGGFAAGYVLGRMTDHQHHEEQSQIDLTGDAADSEDEWDDAGYCDSDDFS